MKSVISIFYFLTYFLALGINAQPDFVKMNDGTKLYYSISGKGKDTLIFLHGGPGQNSKGVAPDLLPLNKKYVLIVYDQRGCGLSEIGDTSKISSNTHAEDLESIRKHFGINKMILIGHSWGCMLAAIYTSQHPQHVRKLLLVSPGPPTRKQFNERFLSFIKKDSIGQSKVSKLRSELENSKDPLAICREINKINERFYFFDDKNLAKRKGDYCDIPEEAILKQALTARLTLSSLGDYNLVPIIKTIHQPTLIIEGFETPVPKSELWVWSESLPNDELVFIKKVGHGFPFVEQPKIFFNKVNRFLK